MTRIELEMYNNPRLEDMLKDGKENTEIINEILKERRKDFFETLTETMEYHN